MIEVKPSTVGLVAAPLLLLASVASAQNNPFLPPQGGLSKAQIQEIVRQEVERAKAGQRPAPGGPQTPGVTGGAPQARPGPTAGQVNSLPPGQGTPEASTAAKLAEAANDPVADLIKNGGVFVGCVGSTPVFKDKNGRRAYFTSKELRESNEARRFSRCS